MKVFLKSALLFTGGVVFGEVAAMRAVLKAMHSRDHMTKDDSLIFESKSDADQVLEGLYDIIETYGIASMADLYDLAGLTSKNFSDTRLGWSDLDSAMVVRCRHGYLLKLPSPITIK